MIKLYGHRWRVARARFLYANPLCVMCKDEGHVTLASVVDHIIAHRGDQVLFWDENNWQALCKPHHDVAKRIEEERGYSSVCGLDGWPLDKKHPANRYRGTS